MAAFRPRILEEVLERLAATPVDEVLVVDNGGDLPPARTRGGPPVRILRPGRNLGGPGRNLAAAEARWDLLLMLDDDSFPYLGTVEHMVAVMRANPRLGALGGILVDVDADGREVTTGREPGSFDWFLNDRADPGTSVPAYFFPEGASLLRTQAFLEVGGCFEPYFMTMAELDLATRLIAAGWDVRYAPDARFGHRRHVDWRLDPARMLRYRIRNQLWYFALRFPAPVAARRILAYAAFDLLEASYRGVPRAWLGGVRDAVVERDRVRGLRAPMSRELIPRVELERGRRHRQLAAIGLARRLGRSTGRGGGSAGAPHRPVGRR